MALAASVLAAPAASAAVPASATPVVINHRGDPLLAPENTLPAWQAAADGGASWIETDIRFSKSDSPTNGDYPIIMHDATVDRTTTGTGNANSFWLADFQKLGAADYAPWKGDSRFTGTKAPYAWDLFSFAAPRGLNLLLDIKVTPTQHQADRLLSYINRFDYASHVKLMLSAAGVKAMKGFYPDLSYVLLESPADGMTRTAESVKATGATGYAASVARVNSSQWVSYYESQGITTLVWTTDGVDDTEANWDRLAGYGVSFLITNHEPDAAASVS
jgi:glycerophosphoryl diester phosphodiesterase